MQEFLTVVAAVILGNVIFSVVGFILLDYFDPIDKDDENADV